MKGLSKKAQKLIEDFEGSVDALAWIGSRPPEEMGDIEKRYVRLKKRLWIYILELENRNDAKGATARSDSRSGSKKSNSPIGISFNIRATEGEAKAREIEEAGLESNENE